MVLSVSLPHSFLVRVFGFQHIKFKIEGEKILYLSDQVALSSEHFHFKVSVRAVNNAGFIHHAGDAWILVDYNLSCKKGHEIRWLGDCSLWMF